MSKYMIAAPCLANRTFSVPAFTPKSQTLFQTPGIGEDKKNQLQIDMLSGSFKEGTVKNWLLLAVKNALYELAPNAPDTWDVGEDADAVSAPVTPEVSRKSSPGLNV